MGPSRNLSFRDAAIKKDKQGSYSCLIDLSGLWSYQVEMELELDICLSLQHRGEHRACLMISIPGSGRLHSCWCHHFTCHRSKFIFRVTGLALVSSLSWRLQFVVRDVISSASIFPRVLGVIALPEMVDCLFRVISCMLLWMLWPKVYLIFFKKDANM